MRRIAALTAGAVVASAASAQSPRKPTDLYAGQGIMRGSPRVFGLAGAFSGVAEGADGLMHNPAALGNRLLPFEHDFNFDVSGVFHLLPDSSLKSQDWDNDGVADRILTNSGIFGTVMAGVAIAAQYKRFGLGLGFDAQGYGDKFDRGGGTTSTVAVGMGHFFAAAALALLNDDVVVGAGVETTNAAFVEVQSPRAASPACTVRREADDCYSYSGLGVYAGVLLRPNRANWRLGGALKYAFPAGPDVAVFGVRPEDRPPFAGLALPKAVVAPPRLSLGFSFRLASEGDVPYNLYRGDFRMQGEEVIGAELPPPLPSRKLLVTTEIVVIFPVRDAVSIQGFFRQNDPDSTVQNIGEQIMFIPRVALEGDPINERLRLRLGTYLEPPAYAGGSWRPHVTFGLELALFKLWQRWSIGASIDVGDRLGGNPGAAATMPPGRPSYWNLSIAILVWK